MTHKTIKVLIRAVWGLEGRNRGIAGWGWMLAGEVLRSLWVEVVGNGVRPAVF